MRAHITGVTPLQLNSQRRRTDYVSLPHALKAALELAGWRVDWTTARVGWEAVEVEDPYDCTFIGISDFESLTANGVYDAAFLYRKLVEAGRRVVFYTDDWQVHTCMGTIFRWGEGRGSGPRKIRTPMNPLRQARMEQSPDGYASAEWMVQRLTDPNNWPPLVVQLLDAASDTRLVERWGLPPVVRWNPMSLFPTWSEFAGLPKAEQWAHAALFNYDEWLAKLDVQWPVVSASDGKNRVPEREVGRLVAQSVGSLSPPYTRIVDSGWVRPRWWFAAHLGTIIAGDPRELGQWAPAYSYTPRDVELMTPLQRETVAEAQREQLLHLTPSRQQAVERAVAIAQGSPAGAALGLKIANTAAALTNPTPPKTPRPARPSGPGVATEYSAMDIRDDDRVLDVGAHRGEFARFVRSRSQTCVLLCYEAEEENYNALVKALGDFTQCMIANKAVIGGVSAAGERVTFPLYLCNGADTTMHSLVPRRGRSSVEVEAEPLCDVMEKFQPTVLKLAVEGYESHLIAALPGCVGFDDVREIAIKHHASTDESRVTAKSVGKLLEEWGFNCIQRPQLDKGSWPVVGVWRKP